MKDKTIDYKSIYYPPGGILLWLIIFLELITFGIALVVLVVYSKEDPALYHESSSRLNVTFGAINTIFLLTSGFFMATSVRQFKKGDSRNASFYMLLTLLGGFLFLVLKSIEYQQKIVHGFVLGYDTFFSFYWLLTGFHVIHVLVGMVIIIFIYSGLKKEKKSMKLEDIEAGAAFWHMCDLIWLLLFPVLYLIF